MLSKRLNFGSPRLDKSTFAWVVQSVASNMLYGSDRLGK